MRVGNFVYGLVDPRDGQLRYVGQTFNGMFRPEEHSKRGNIRWMKNKSKVAWLTELTCLGVKPDIVVLEECADRNSLNEAEMFYIAYYRSLGCSLLNMTDGGPGAKGRKMSLESRSKLSKNLTGLKRSQAHNDRMAEVFAGRKLSEEHRLKLATANKGKKPSQHAIEAAKTARRGPLIDGNGVVYPSIEAAMKALGLGRQAVRSLVRGERKMLKGHSLSYYVGLE